MFDGDGSRKWACESSGTANWCEIAPRLTRLHGSLNHEQVEEDQGRPTRSFSGSWRCAKFSCSSWS
jgi:hypothetical protein